MLTNEIQLNPKNTVFVLLRPSPHHPLFHAPHLPSASTERPHVVRRAHIRHPSPPFNPAPRSPKREQDATPGFALEKESCEEPGSATSDHQLPLICNFPPLSRPPSRAAPLLESLATSSICTPATTGLCHNFTLQGAFNPHHR